MTKRVLRGRAVLTLATLAFLVLTPIVGCGGRLDIPPWSDDAGSGADATLGDAAATPREDASGDAATIDSASDDACGPPSDWPGFRRVTELNPCIMNDVLVDPDAGFSLAWTDCVDAGIPGCKSVPLLQTGPGWNELGNVPRVAAYATHDDAGSGADMMVVQLDETQSSWKFQYDVFDIKTQARLAEWREQQGPPSWWFVLPFSVEGQNHATAYLAGVNGGVATFGSAPTLGSSNPMVTTWTPFPQAALDAHVSGTWTLFSDSPEMFCVNATGQCGPYGHFFPGGLVEVAWRDVMFENAPVSGWLAEVVLSLNAAPIVLRAVPNTHVWGFRTDGIDMVWNESTGDPNVIDDQTNTDVWMAPYTLNPTQLAATATKVVSLGPGRIGPFAAYFNGMFAFVLAYEVWVVDVMTGKAQVVPAIDGYGPDSLAYVDHTAIWEVLTNVASRGLFVSIPLAQ